MKEKVEKQTWTVGCAIDKMIQAPTREPNNNNIHNQIQHQQWCYRISPHSSRHSLSSFFVFPLVVSLAFVCFMRWDNETQMEMDENKGRNKYTEKERCMWRVLEWGELGKSEEKKKLLRWVYMRLPRVSYSVRLYWVTAFWPSSFSNVPKAVLKKKKSFLLKLIFFSSSINLKIDGFTCVCHVGLQ